jgi:hypothetical protein
MNCKQGDLAFIKKAIRPENIGLIVSCAQYLGYYLKDDMVELNKEFYLAVVSDNYWRIGSESGSIMTQYGKSKVSFIPDTWLTPIKELPVDDEDGILHTLDEELTIHA